MKPKMDFMEPGVANWYGKTVDWNENHGDLIGKATLGFYFATIIIFIMKDPSLLAFMFGCVVSITLLSTCCLASQQVVKKRRTLSDVKFSPFWLFIAFVGWAASCGYAFSVGTIKWYYVPILINWIGVFYNIGMVSENLELILLPVKRVADIDRRFVIRDFIVGLGVAATGILSMVILAIITQDWEGYQCISQGSLCVAIISCIIIAARVLITGISLIGNFSRLQVE